MQDAADGGKLPAALISRGRQRVVVAEHVVRAVDKCRQAVPSATEIFDDAVVRDGLADHWPDMLGVQAGSVDATRG